MRRSNCPFLLPFISRVRDVLGFNVRLRYLSLFIADEPSSASRQSNGWNPDLFDDNYEEASRLLRLSLHVICVESDPAMLATLPDPRRPPITFGGTMRGFNSDEVLDRAVKGTVSVMPDGNIRWSFVSAALETYVCSSPFCV